MRIAMPIADGKFSTHYGRAKGLSVHDVDLETGTSVDLGLKPFPETGTCSAASWVAQQGIDVLLAGGLGGGAAQGLGKHGIKVLAGVQEEDPAKVLASFLAGVTRVVELAPGESMCNGHDDDHDHHGEGHVCTCKG